MKNLNIQKQEVIGHTASIFFRFAFAITVTLFAAFGLLTTSVSAAEPISTTCTAYDVITVKATAKNYLVNPNLLNAIGFDMVDGGSIEFEYSYQFKPDENYTSPGKFVLKSLDVDGNVIGNYVYTNPIDISVQNNRVQPYDGYLVDHYSIGFFPEINGTKYLLVFHLINTINLDALPNSPLVYLNDLSLWEVAKSGFAVGVDINHDEQFILALATSLTSVKAASVPSTCVSTQDLSNLVTGLSTTSFRSEGNRTALLARIENINQMILAGNYTDAVADMKDLLRKMDGCGTSPDSNDWLMVCSEQVKIRTEVYKLIVALGGSL